MNKPPCMVWLPADHRLMGDHGHQMPFLLLGDKYARAVKVGADAQPVMFPLADTGQPLDADRDLLTLALVKACVHEGVPLLGICRGFQEINVALGGTLHQRVHEVPGMMDHREPKTAPPDEQYAPRHSIRFAPGSVVEEWAGGPEAQVNSLHGQGINRLAAGLDALAHAPDGLVEAFGVRGARTFAYAVQFHPEWRCWETPFYAAIFEAFGRACRQRMNLRLQHADLARA
jgi:putative glutamine amidotransferase